MRKCSGGFFINKIIQDAKLKIDGRLTPQNRKLFLYSAHEFNLVYVLGALNLFEGKIPPYSSYIVFELHKIDDEYGFKVGRNKRISYFNYIRFFCRFFIRIILKKILDY